MNSVPLRHTYTIVGLILLFCSSVSTCCLAQDVPPPKPKANPPSSSPKPKSGSTVAPPSAYGLVVKADTDCNVSVDGGDPVLVRAGKAHRFASGLGQHLVQAETLNGDAKDEQSVDQKEPQLVVQMNLSSVLAKKAEDQRKEKEEVEARQKAIAGLRDFVGSWICFFQEDKSGVAGVYTSEKTGREHHSEGAGRHEEVTWNLQLRQDGGAIVGFLSRTFNYALIKAPGKVLYDSFTWNGRQVTSTTYTLYYAIEGAPQSSGQTSLDAIYQRCSGDCGDIDNDPRSQDMKGGTAEVKFGGLEWTNKLFSPNTKVFKRQ